jgi:hypothetical protein
MLLIAKELSPNFFPSSAVKFPFKCGIPSLEVRSEAVFFPSSAVFFPSSAVLFP